MSKGRPFIGDPFGLEQRRFHYDPDTGDFGIESTADVADVIRMNTAQVNDHGRDRMGDMQHVASIPGIIWNDLVAKGIAQNPERLKKWLEDPDNRAFRTHLAKLGR